MIWLRYTVYFGESPTINPVRKASIDFSSGHWLAATGADLTGRQYRGGQEIEKGNSEINFLQNAHDRHPIDDVIIQLIKIGPGFTQSRYDGDLHLIHQVQLGDGCKPATIV